MYYIGIDLGTSSVKMLLMEENGTIVKTVSGEYPLEFPKPGWSQQKPEDWWERICEKLPELLEGIDKSKVKGIGVGGQMHGLVVLDEADQVIRPAILWNDGRTEKEVEYLNNVIGKEKLSEYTANIAFAGFTAPKILWMEKNEPELFAKIAKIMLPKDYINYKLTGVFATDVSDASGMLLMDVKNKCWSKGMLDICHIKEEQMATIFESYEKIGCVSKEIAAQFGIPEDVAVAAGAGDNAAAAVGTGTVGDGNCNISLGTSGTVFISSEKFGVDENNALHSFAHADGKYHLMGCMLSAASCNNWLMKNIFETDDFAREQSLIKEENLGHNHLFFLPYLMGERSPINDTNARGTFIGATMDTTRADFTQAVLEGVAFAVKDMFVIAEKLGIHIEKSKICGGGAKSALWKRMIASILNIKLEILVSEQGPGMGGAMLAMVATGAYASVEEACKSIVEVAEVVEPEPNLVALYQERYEKFRQIYPATKELFKHIV